jgi:hypothetical protein
MKLHTETNNIFFSGKEQAGVKREDALLTLKQNLSAALPLLQNEGLDQCSGSEGFFGLPDPDPLVTRILLCPAKKVRKIIISLSFEG